MGCAYLMLGDNRTSKSEQALLVAYTLNASWWTDDYGGGANLSDMLRAQLMRSLAASSANVTGVTQAFDAMWANVVVGNATSNWQGVVQSGAFHFHGEDVLTSAYGVAWLSDQLDFFAVALNTSFEMPPLHTGALALYLGTGIAASTFGTGYDWATQGRGVSRPATKFTWGLSPTQVRAVAAAPQAAPWADAIANLADRLEGRGTSLPVNYVFWDSDYAVHHRATWGASVRMHSNKTAAGYAVVGSECDNSEDVLAEHFGDGLLNVYSSGVGEPGRNAVVEAYGGVFPLLDWQGLNGITVEHDVPLEKCVGDVWPLKWTQFVGGVSDGLYGSVAMDTATHALTGRRAWFFFDAVVLALGANFTDASPANVRTSLASRLMPAGNLTLAFANGTVAVVGDGAYEFPVAEKVAWVQGASMGWVPHVAALAPAAAPGLGVEFSTKNGSWSVIGPHTDRAVARTLAMWLDHGARLDGASYAYLLAPNASAADMATLAPDNGGVVCGVNSAGVQGATVVAGAPGVDGDLLARAGAGGPTGSLTQAVFWDASAAYACVPAGRGVVGGGPRAWPLAGGTAAAAATVTVSTQCMLLVAANATSVSITVSNPVAVGGSVVVTLGGLAVAPGGPSACAASGGGSALAVTVAMPPDADHMGASVSVTCPLR